MGPTQQRTGPFWDAVEGRRPLPPAAATLGLELVAVDPERGSIDLAFDARDDFTTPLGDVLGGFLAAMLYDTVGPALLATIAPDSFIETLDLQVRFLRPAAPGRLTAHGQIVARDSDTAFVDAVLNDRDGTVVASATSTLRVVPTAERRAKTAAA